MNTSATRRLIIVFCCSIASLHAPGRLSAQMLDDELQRMSVQELVRGARESGDAARGAVIFFQPQMACSRCHVAGSNPDTLLGPDLTKPGNDTSDEALVESVLYPSKVIRERYEPWSVLTVDGKQISGLLVARTPEKVVLRDVARDGETIAIATDEIDEVKRNELSVMPAGQMNQLNSRQQFYDLIRYLIEIRDGGIVRALELQPSPALLTFTVPEYENRLDHAGLLVKWNDESFRRGEAIYNRVCANCHGTHNLPGSLPNSIRFAEGQFKNGSDPLSMYRTLTHGFGQMAAQSWMVPSQKYDVIHYIRQAYLQQHNPSQLTPVTAEYLASLPKGETFGPEPSTIEAWSAMNYGPSLIHTYEVPGPKHNFAYKGVAVRLDPGAGGVSRGRHWMVFDTDTLRVAAGWSADDEDRSGNQENFINWRAIQFNGEHGIHPGIVGEVAFANSTGPGWANPATGEFRDDQRVVGRDDRRYGPLPREWGQFRGIYHYDQRTVFSYSIGDTSILESPGLYLREQQSPLLLRTFNIGPRDRDLILQVAEHPAAGATMSPLADQDPSAVRIALPDTEEKPQDNGVVRFDGETYVEIPDADALDMTGRDFTIVARIRTATDGTIFSVSDGGEKWVPNGQTFFVRGGRLGFDIGWVGAVTGQTRVDDNEWHIVALAWEQATSRVRLYVDGRLDGEGSLAAKANLSGPIARIGFTSPDFPQPASFFDGEIAQVCFYQECISQGLKDFPTGITADTALMANWNVENRSGDVLEDESSHGLGGKVRRGDSSLRPDVGPILAGYAPGELDAQWLIDEGKLRLRIPAGENPLRFSLWIPCSVDGTDAPPVTQIPGADLDLTAFTKGGPPRWAQVLTTQAAVSTDDGPYAVDSLTPPESNPWLALTRFTGLDFFPDGRIAVCTWDGDVWLLTQRKEEGKGKENPLLDWRRIASGLFQPLGIKIVNEKIHLICRDQLVVLHDLNADGEVDFYECLNNDHQVTEHFHEFAMGLQTDAEGNFYYAKSGCHGKAAVVPHHGTLLRITADGSRTDILANGFRAANGVCLNPDGSFVVTDQEGYWNPKNRINWVTVSENEKPKFYGNMLGYHDITDSADSAMVPPLCWITNEFDRSPAELLWVDSASWGPLNGSLLNLSYGYGKVFLVLHEKVNGMMQGGMIELPLPTFPTGVMRGRFHPADGHLYMCGMFAWAGNATQPGGLYRVRSTGKPTGMPLSLNAHSWGIEMTFAETVDPDAVADIQNYSIKAWDLKRTAKYGSDHFNERSWPVRSARLMPDGMTVRLEIPDIAPTWGMEIVYTLRAADGKPLRGKIHNTIHQLRGVAQ